MAGKRSGKTSKHTKDKRNKYRSEKHSVNKKKRIAKQEKAEIKKKKQQEKGKHKHVWKLHDNGRKLCDICGKEKLFKNLKKEEEIKKYSKHQKEKIIKDYVETKGFKLVKRKRNKTKFVNFK